MLKLWIDFYVSWTSRNGFHNLIYHINLKLLGENTALHNFVYPLNLPLKINVVDSFHLHLQMMLYVITSTNWDEIKITKEEILRTIDDELFFTNGSVLRFTVFRNNSPKRDNRWSSYSASNYSTNWNVLNQPTPFIDTTDVSILQKTSWTISSDYFSLNFYSFVRMNYFLICSLTQLYYEKTEK